MTEFIKGAAYVSAKRNKAYTGDELEVYEENDLVPDDLICIYEPGDELDDPIDDGYRPTIRIKGTPLIPDEVKDEMGCMRQTPLPEDLRTSLTDAVEVIRLQQRGWFYPTRLQEHSGRYEDEARQIWIFDRQDGPQWYLETENTWTAMHIPTWDRDGKERIAVRWLGEVDDD